MHLATREDKAVGGIVFVSLFALVSTVVVNGKDVAHMIVLIGVVLQDLTGVGGLFSEMLESSGQRVVGVFGYHVITVDHACALSKAIVADVADVLRVTLMSRRGAFDGSQFATGIVGVNHFLTIGIDDGSHTSPAVVLPGRVEGEGSVTVGEHVGVHVMDNIAHEVIFEEL